MNLNQTASLANQMKARDRDMVPRFLVIAMFSLMAASLALVSFARLTGMPPTAIASLPEIVAERIELSVSSADVFLPEVLADNDML